MFYSAKIVFCRALVSKILIGHDLHHVYTYLHKFVIGGPKIGHVGVAFIDKTYPCRNTKIIENPIGGNLTCQCVLTMRLTYYCSPSKPGWDFPFPENRND